MNRRNFLKGAGAVGALAGAGLWATHHATRAPEGIVDLHVHLFGDSEGSGPVHKRRCWISPTQKQHPNYRFLPRLLGIRPGENLSEAYVDRLIGQLRAARIAKAALMAYDCRYDASGAPDWANTTSIYVPNEYLFEVVRKHPDRLLACPSINPQRADWRAELDYCSREGARILKLHPPTQNVDPSQPAFRDFYRECAARRIAIVTHTGTEHSAAIVGNHLCDPRLLRLALDQGCTVVAAHAAMSDALDRPADDFFPHLVTLMKEYPNLYCDTAVLCGAFRWRCVPRLLREEAVIARTLHGSDFPFPPNALVFWNRLHPFTLLRLLAERNLFIRDYELKKALGLPDKAFTNAARVLG